MTAKNNLTNRAESAQVIICDTRQQRDLHITSYFDRNGIPWKREKVEAGDYQIEGDFKTLVDSKKDILEICGNLTRTSEHERVKREVQRAKDLGCERFVFLIADPQIKFVDEVYTWKRPMNWKTKKYRTQVQPATLQKIMQTFAERYGVEFIFCTKLQMGKMVANLLLDQNLQKDDENAK